MQFYTKVPNGAESHLVGLPLSQGFSIVKTPKIRVGIFFGGASREREVSFAGGRTVYDNLDKTIFDPIPIFVDAFGNLLLLDWSYIYKGTIRDFFPTESQTKDQKFRVYAESLETSSKDYMSMLSELGKVIALRELSSHIDFAFLVLHGAYGEDGTVQGLLDWLKIPYSGSRILSSAIGINKSIQRKWMENAGLEVPKYLVFTKEILSSSDKENIEKKVGFPCVVKPANQGSSVGVNIAKNKEQLDLAFQQAWGRHELPKNLSKEELHSFASQNLKLNHSIGFPMLMDGEEIKHPEQLMALYRPEKGASLQAMQNESEIIVEAFIKGREFSAIVLENQEGKPIVLPPTEIIKNSEIYHYDAKYLPGISRKKTPMEISPKQMKKLGQEVLKLYKLLDFNVYARIDGFVTEEGKVLLNDPNTTSGMMPSSFFFHQAAEVSMDPKTILSIIIRNSLNTGIKKSIHREPYRKLRDQLKKLYQFNQKEDKQRKIAVIMGGYSTERHISMESGRNIFEKLNSSNAFQALPIFLRKKQGKIQLYQLPMSYLLKDNADDIADKIDRQRESKLAEEIKKDFENDFIIEKQNNTNQIVETNFEELSKRVDFVFIALHGRPGEDGEIQKELSRHHLPFNGSSVESSQLTINKFETNNLLRSKGIIVANNYLLKKENWQENKERCLEEIAKLSFPLIAKPVDEGCSSAVIKIDQVHQLESYANLAFRGKQKRNAQDEIALGLKKTDEFPSKKAILLESFVQAKENEKLIEITGGMLVQTLPDHSKKYQVFEPSEVLSQTDILSLEEKFLAGEGQNITPARFSMSESTNDKISEIVKQELKKTAQFLNVEGYCRIDAFVKIKQDGKVEVYIIEINSLPGMTPATCIYHQAAISGYTPLAFIQQIIDFGTQRPKTK